MTSDGNNQIRIMLVADRCRLPLDRCPDLYEAAHAPVVACIRTARTNSKLNVSWW